MLVGWQLLKEVLEKTDHDDSKKYLSEVRSSFPLPPPLHLADPRRPPAARVDASSPPSKPPSSAGVVPQTCLSHETKDCCASPRSRRDLQDLAADPALASAASACHYSEERLGRRRRGESFVEQRCSSTQSACVQEGARTTKSLQRRSTSDWGRRRKRRGAVWSTL